MIGKLDTNTQISLFKPAVIVNRNISKFKGRNLIIGCGNCKSECCLKHPKNDFYSIDIDSKKSPDLCFDITKQIPVSLLPDKRFDFIYFENIDLTCFIDMQNKRPKTETFKNISRLLSENGVCAIATAPIAFISLGKYKNIKYKGNYFSSTILCEYACQEGEFSAGRLCKSASGFDGGLFIIRKSNIDENEVISHLSESAQWILEFEFINHVEAHGVFRPFF